jgi:capsular polysaccharide biosynthesis protein
MELRRYLQIVRRWAWLILLGTLLAAGVAFTVSSRVPPTYRAVSSLVVGVQDEEGGWRAFELNRQVTATYREVLATRPVIEEAAASLDLPLATVNELLSRVTVWVVPDTTMIRVAVQDHDPELAMQLANEIVSVFLEMREESDALQGPVTDMVEPATLPAEPAGPRIWLNTLVAAMGGCALAVGMALLLEYLGAAPSATQDAPVQGEQAGGSTTAPRTGQRPVGTLEREPD